MSHSKRFIILSRTIHCSRTVSDLTSGEIKQLNNQFQKVRKRETEFLDAIRTFALL